MSSRLRAFDVLRGLSILSMVAFHYCYDLAFLTEAGLLWFRPPLQDIWRASISWVFLLIAGCMCSFSSDNLRRAVRYGALSLAIYLTTLFASVDTPISFGIIFCMAASTFVEWLLETLNVKPFGPVAALLYFFAFLLCLKVPSGYVGIGPWYMALPKALYATPWFSWLGLPGPGFASGDYYPLIPFGLLFLCGSSLGRWLKERGYPNWFHSITCPPLEFVGRHPLVIYVAHQPILLLLCGALS